MSGFYTLNVFDKKGRLFCVCTTIEKNDAVLALTESKHNKKGFHAIIYNSWGYPVFDAPLPV